MLKDKLDSPSLGAFSPPMGPMDHFPPSSMGLGMGLPHGLPQPHHFPQGLHGAQHFGLMKFEWEETNSVSWTNALREIMWNLHFSITSHRSVSIIVIYVHLASVQRWIHKLSSGTTLNIQTLNWVSQPCIAQWWKSFCRKKDAVLWAYYSIFNDHSLYLHQMRISWFGDNGIYAGSWFFYA